MNRLDTERLRLFGPAQPAADGPVRAGALDIHQRAGWEAVAAIWQGVQDELSLPAPAVAINGVDGYQLWFSLATPVEQDELLAWLDALRRRCVSTIPATHFKPLLPTDALPSGTTIPARQSDNGCWSAFVAPGLAPMFADEPWLDLPPSDDAQADLLAPLHSIKPDDWQRSLRQLAAATAEPMATAPAQTSSSDAVAPPSPPLPNTDDPRQFLLAVMNDPGITLALRIEAAKALLPRT